MSDRPQHPVLAEPQRRAVLWLTVAAICWRVLLARRTPVPAEDGVVYLWMAQQFAAGDAAAALSEPFSPLWPALLAVPIALGSDPFVAGKIVGAVCGGMLVWPVALLAERVRAGAALPAAAFAATSSLLARTAVEVYTEPLFALAIALGLLAALAGRWWWLGGAAATAFLVRPEGVLLPAVFVLAAPRRAWRALVPVAGAVVAFGAWRAACGLGFDPVPKLSFHGLRDDLAGRGDLLANLVALPTAYMEAFLAAGLLAALALWPPVSRGTGRLWGTLLVAFLPIVTFVVRRRFFVGWGAAVFALAGVAVARMRLGTRGRELLLAVACGLDLWTAWNGTIEADRIAERLVGEHLAGRLAPGETVSGDMTRVLWFAGQRALPARHFDAAALVAMAASPGVRFVVLSERSQRDVHDEVVAALGATFTRYDLPAGLRDQADRRGITVLVRR